MMARLRVSNSRKGLSAFVLLVLLGVLVFGTPLHRGFAEFFAEVVSFSATDSPYAGVSRQELASRLADSEVELARTRYQAVVYQKLVEENNNLRTIAGIENFTKKIPARVIARPPRTNYDILLLDQGSNAGITVNDTVVIEGIALGKIVSVSEGSAHAELLSAPGAEHDALLGDPQAVAVAKGVGGGAFEIVVPQEVVVAPGDSVRAPHSETLISGVVVSVKGEPSDATKVVYATMPISFSSLDFVAVIPHTP